MNAARTDAPPTGLTDSDRQSRQWWPPSVEAVARLGIGIVFAISFLDLLGWALDLPLLKSILPHWVPMKVITALCLMFCAMALVLVRDERTTGRRRRSAAAALGITVCLVALLTVATYAIEMSTGRAAALATAPIVTLFLAPLPRMAMLTAIVLLLIGGALVLLAAENRRADGLAHVLVLPAATASYVVPISYLLDVHSIHEVLHVPVALNTGVALCALCVTILCARPQSWLMRVLTGDHAGGFMARQLLPGLILLPLTIGWLRLYGERVGAFPSDVGVALVAVTYTVCFVGLVWLSARSVNRTDERRYAAERAVQTSEERYRSLFNGMTEGFALHEILCDAAGRPCDYRFVDVNPAFEQLTGLRRAKIIGRTAKEILPKEDPEWIKIYGEVALTGQSVHFDNYSRELQRHYEVFAYQPAPRQFATLVMDITERKRAVEKLRHTAAELTRSNRELEQFAYVASHDLQEPLRAVTGYLGLFETRWRDKVDDKGRYHIQGAIEGAVRMNKLITDLLRFSRVGTRDESQTRVNLDTVLDEVLASLSAGIRETGAQITRDPLPTLRVDYSQMAQVFQNLIGNALKFHGDRTPVIHVAAKKVEGGQAAEANVEPSEVRDQRSEGSIQNSEDGRREPGANWYGDAAAAARAVLGVPDLHPAFRLSQQQTAQSEGGPVWLFSVRDNGIGIEAPYFERIFMIFQRLHTRRHYPGTGLGLAICRKIVERHGGRIWVESQPGQGSTFYFTLPERTTP